MQPSETVSEPCEPASVVSVMVLRRSTLPPPPATCGTTPSANLNVEADTLAFVANVTLPTPPARPMMTGPLVSTSKPPASATLPVEPEPEPTVRLLKTLIELPGSSISQPVELVPVPMLVPLVTTEALETIKPPAPPLVPTVVVPFVATSVPPVTLTVPVDPAVMPTTRFEDST